MKSASFVPIMTKLRIFLRRYVILFFIALCFYIVLGHLIYKSDDYGDSVSKILQIEENIRSPANRGQCKLPELPVWSPEIVPFLKNVTPIDCKGSKRDWVRCFVSTCYVVPQVLKDKGKIYCKYYEIYRIDDDRIQTSSSRVITFESEADTFELLDSDFVHLQCRTDIGSDRWDGIAYGVRKQLGRNIPEENRDKFNVLMLGFDSLSRNAFIRKLPKSYKYLTEKIGAHVLKGYNIVGDGTPQALIPILTGFTELELPDTKRRRYHSEFVNIYPMIWKDYEEMGYITSFNEDVPHIGTFTYRLNGFSEQPTDHYMRTFYLAIKPKLKNYAQFCIGDRPGHQAMLEYTKQFMLRYTNHPKFVFSFHGELSHDSINLIGVADDDLQHWLMELHDRLSILDNTILILMSDHGNRFAAVRNTIQGKQEERLPFFSFYFPNKFQAKYSSAYKNFVGNIEKLTTPFDIHETFKDLLALQYPRAKVAKPKTQFSKTELASQRAISLFKEIPSNRSCFDAYIEPHWCACLAWDRINNTNSTTIRSAANAIIKQINLITKTRRRICSQLSLKEINWSAKLTPNKDLVQFVSNKDQDGFLGTFDTNTKKPYFEIYQLSIVAEPGNSIFEASVTHTGKSFEVLTGDISRVNKYGSQAACIMEEDPELRKFCYCI